MRFLLAVGFFSAVIALAVPVPDAGNDECEQVFVTVGAGITSATSSVTASSTTKVSVSSVTSASTPDATQAVSSSQSSDKVTTTSSNPSGTDGAPGGYWTQMPDRPDGTPGFLIEGQYHKAPRATEPVPGDAAIFTPKDGKTLDCAALADWITHQRDEVKPASKYLKIAPGAYRYKPGPQMAPGTDPNTVKGENIVLYLLKGGWTFDFRDVTFLIDFGPELTNQRPSVMIYCLQSDDLTIYGGTIWIDQGEQWTQARVTDLNSDGKATFEVMKGYNVSAWNTAGPRNQGCIDDSNPTHFKRQGCNFWKVQNYDFSSLHSSRTFTASVLDGSSLKSGYVVYMQVGGNSLITMSTENNPGLHVKGLTSNGYFMQIGLWGETAVVEDLYYVNPGPRPGFDHRVNGPTLSWGHIDGFNYDAPNEAKTIFKNSYWQYTGCPTDLQDGNNNTIPIG